MELNNPTIKTEATTAASTTTTTTANTVDTSSIAPISQSTATRPGQINVEWRFKCKCNEVCSSYEAERYHPGGQWFECTMCSIWSHVHCMFGLKTTPQDIEIMPQALCNSCLTKQRRTRSRDSVEVVTESTSTGTGAVVVDVSISHSRRMMMKKKKKNEEVEVEEEKKTSCPSGEESELIGISLNGCSTTTSIETKSLEEVSVKSLTDSLNCNTSSEDTSIIDDGSVVIMSSSCSNAPSSPPYQE